MDAGYFCDEIKPLLDDPLIDFIGEIGDSEKSAFLGNANALLFPIDWPEPFGLVLIEAMACGTPVIAWPCGSVSEIIDDGKTGFLVDTEDEAVRAVLKLDQLDRRTVRRVFQDRFTADVMARNYLRLYWRLCEQPAELTSDAVFSLPACGRLCRQTVAVIPTEAGTDNPSAIKRRRSAPSH